MESLADPANMGGFDENDPQSMSRWMKNMAGEMGEDFDEGMMAEMEAASEGGSPEGEGPIGSSPMDSSNDE